MSENRGVGIFFTHTVAFRTDILRFQHRSCTTVTMSDSAEVTVV